MDFHRASGVLLHPTSFPGPYGIGELGQAAYQFVDFLAKAKQSLWQVLPLGPTGYGDSPYASFSTFAGNPLLISIEKLMDESYLSSSDLADMPDFSADQVDYGQVMDWKMPILERAAKNFFAQATEDRRKDFDRFCKDRSHWLDDYALFMVVKAHFDQKAKDEGVFGAMWSSYWDRDIALRQTRAVRRWKRQSTDEMNVHKVWQYFFYTQWAELKQYANDKGIKIIGDIPIFVAPDSVDVWANRELFHLDENGRPSVVAGVPPDYFSETGQLWGNPLYHWIAMAGQGYRWWIDRIKANLELVDIIRVDHFRGFESYWQVSAGEETAENGIWVKAPGRELFETIEEELGHLPILAEDLGIITQEVEDLRDYFGFPGMNVLQFAFDVKEDGKLDGTNFYLPHNHAINSVVYTGTHDNDTTKGWYQQCTEAQKDLIRRYLARPDDDIVWDLIRMAMASASRYAIIPMQDILNLDSSARMNTPSKLGGNWAWRYRPEALSDWASNRLVDLVDLFGRDPALWAEKEKVIA